MRFKDFELRNDAHIKEVMKRSNVIINLLGLAKETPNFTFEDVHIKAPTRIATLAAEAGVAERLIHVSCLGASENSASRRLRTKVRLATQLARSGLQLVVTSCAGQQVWC